MVVNVGRISILYLVIYFVVYLAIHIIIGAMKDKSEEQLKENINSLELIKKVKIYNILFTWFPAIYLVFVVIMFYA